MTDTEKIAIAAIIISTVSLFITFLRFRREKKKSNQDILFQEKLNAYRKISFEAHKVYTDFFDLVDEVQFYKGEEKEWQEVFEGYCSVRYAAGFDFKKMISQYVVIIPSSIYKKADDLSLLFLGFVTLTNHCDSEMTINAYDKVGNKLQDLIDSIRQDINVDKLNIELSKRIE